MNNDSLVAFTLKGYIAQFRRFYSTTSSLSYTFPPRTTLEGIIAAILGLDRDSYYDVLSSDECDIAVRVLTPVRRITFSVNYLLVKDKPIVDVQGVGRRTQITTEYLVNGFESSDPLAYRIYFRHDDAEMNKKIFDYLINRTFVYPLSLGPAYALSWVDDVKFLKYWKKYSSGEVIDISSPIERDLVKEVKMVDNLGSIIFYEEYVPVDFSIDRIISKTKNYIVPAMDKSIKVVLEEGVEYITIEDDKLINVAPL